MEERDHNNWKRIKVMVRYCTVLSFTSDACMNTVPYSLVINHNYYGLNFHEHSRLPCIQCMIQCLEESNHDYWKGVKVMVRYCKQAHAFITLGGS